MMRLSFPREMIAIGLALGLAAVAVEPASRLLSGGLPWKTSSVVEAVTGSATLHFVPYGIDRGICDRSLLANDLKGGTARAGGTVDNALVGTAAGAKMDIIDQNCVGRVLEYAMDSRRIYWRNGDNGFTYAVVPTRTYQDATGAYCREFHTSASSGSLLQQVHGLACRRSDGAWRATH
jgi:surface antigen